MARKKMRTASKMFPLIAKFKSSGMSQKPFCKENGITYSVFQYWLTKYHNTKNPKAVPKESTFKELKVTAAQPERMIIIKYESGTEVRIPV